MIKGIMLISAGNSFNWPIIALASVLAVIILLAVISNLIGVKRKKKNRKSDNDNPIKVVRIGQKDDI